MCGWALLRMHRYISPHRAARWAQSHLRWLVRREKDAAQHLLLAARATPSDDPVAARLIFAFLYAALLSPGVPRRASMLRTMHR